MRRMLVAAVLAAIAVPGMMSAGEPDQRIAVETFAALPALTDPVLSADGHIRPDGPRLPFSKVHR